MHWSAAMVLGTAERIERKTAFDVHLVRLVALLDRGDVIAVSCLTCSKDSESGETALFLSEFAIQVAIIGSANS